MLILNEMGTITLTKLERAILANQNKILALLDQNDSDYYNRLVGIAEHGYEGLYYELVENIYDGVSKEICDETFEILTMYRVIRNSIATLSEEEKETLDLEKIKFEGFDANNDDHYGFMEFLIEKEDKYGELKEMDRNSHDSLTIDKYRRILKVFRSKKGLIPLRLNIQDLKEMIEAV